MAKTNGKKNGNGTTNGQSDTRDTGGELHQQSGTPLTTNQGVPVSDDQNMLRVGARGPALLEDFHFIEKIIEAAKRGRIWAREDDQADKPKPPAKKSAKLLPPPPPKPAPAKQPRR